MGPDGMVAAAEALAASGRSAEKLSLSSLQSKMKCDPEGYESELHLIYNQFNSSLELFQKQAAMSFTSVTGIGSDPTVAKDLGDRAMFLSHVTPFYPKHLADFPRKLADLLRCAARTLPSGLRCHLTHALILLANRKVVDVGETLSLFMELQTLGDRTLKKLAFDHVVHSIRRMNQKHKNEAKNRALQNVLFGLLQKEEEESAKRALVTLCELHRRKVWFDERTANAICTASFHPSSRIMIAALSFLLDYEKIQDDDDSDDSGSDDETNESPQVVLSRETLYKASHQGTAASKKKKKAKLQRAIRSMKKQQRMSSERTNNSYYSPLNHLKDAQGFAEKLFTRLKNCNERFEVKMMILKLIARTIGLHRLFVLDFYPFLQKYIQPHQRDITNLLAAVVQACHDMVPPDAVEPLFKQIVNQFVHDRSRPEAITVGLNAVREICMRMPLLMNEDLLQDLALYKKSREKAVSVAARSLIGLFRELCPSLLVKKDRGRPIDPKARPKAYGEVTVATDVSGVELLQTVDNDEQDGDHSDDSACSDSDNDQQNDPMSINDDDDDDDDDDGDGDGDGDGEGDIQTRLDKLLCKIEEPDLSEEQIRINDQLQQDEILVVESIYGENVFGLERWKGLRCFQIHIHIDVLGEIAITAKLNSLNQLETVSRSSDEFLYTFKVHYLPPVVLTCLLPKSYPSHQPPIFTLSVKWLEPAKILRLCSKLDSIWAEQQGQEVIYPWVEWLHGSSLSHLGFDEEITLGPYGMNVVQDERVVSGAECIDIDIPFLRNYNDKRHNENFLKELHQCNICFGEYAGSEFIRIPCMHFFCLKCLQTFAQIHVKEGTVSNLQCPEAKCTVMIPPGLLKHLLDDRDYERWESMMLEKTLASMSDVVYCPRCETPCLEDEDQHAQCPKCYFSFCTLCRERRHVGIACMSLDMKLQILQDRQNSSHLKEDQKRREREKINEMLSMKEIHRDSKLCPSCDMAISRTEGCNKMKCGNCEQYFCYRCNKAIDPSDPYGHFRDGSCELFPREMVESWQERINNRQVVGQLQAELFPQRGLTCPNCRQFNAKIGNNNHLFCWACQSHYCYLCKEIVRRGTKHYGPKGCKQHSEG